MNKLLSRTILFYIRMLLTSFLTTNIFIIFFSFIKSSLQLEVLAFLLLLPLVEKSQYLYKVRIDNY